MSHAQFADLHPPLSAGAALAEANRCLYFFDAPCTTACPKHIDVPGFIRKITGDNAIGAAHRILDANILGGSCARACPVEVLCEGSCVLHHAGDAPIKIGLLQRHAVDAFYDCGSALPFTPATETGLRVALIGAGPASLACAAPTCRRCCEHWWRVAGSAYRAGWVGRRSRRCWLYCGRRRRRCRRCCGPAFCASGC